jgi:hypothetical protein
MQLKGPQNDDREKDISGGAWIGPRMKTPTKMTAKAITWDKSRMIYAIEALYCTTPMSPEVQDMHEDWTGISVRTCALCFLALFDRLR